MALDQASLKQLCEELLRNRENYNRTLNKAHDAVAKALELIATPGGTVEPEFVPTEQRLGGRSEPQVIFETREDELYVPRYTLPAETFTDDDFRTHLKLHTWKEGSLDAMLGALLSKFESRTWPDNFKDDPDLERARKSYIRLDSVGIDGVARPDFPPSPPTDVAKIWRAFGSTNNHSTTQQQAAGRIAFICEPTALSLLIVHFVMNTHFDMDKIYRGLENSSPTRAIMDGCFESDHRKQRSFVYTLKYHTIIGDERQPMEWQMTDNIPKKTSDRIPISTCCSTIALSLSGSPMVSKNIPKQPGNITKDYRSGVCNIFDPFAPWRLLSLHFCPDWKTTVSTAGSVIDGKYMNGPEAFLSCLLMEFHDAADRFGDLTRRIEALVTPPADFIFNGNLRDKLLFEDQDFTYSRRYFWATHTLSILNRDIKDIIDSYRKTFTEDVWSGRHEYIWPGTKGVSTQYANWRARMDIFKRKFDLAILRLEQQLERNLELNQETNALRNQLFSGTSVLESRKNVELAAVTIVQGHNIKLLTLVAILFLPPTFVGTIFGMTNMPSEGSFRPFAISIALICLPFYILIGLLNTTAGVEFWRDKWYRLVDWVVTKTRPSNSSPKQWV